MPRWFVAVRPPCRVIRWSPAANERAGARLRHSHVTDSAALGGGEIVPIRMLAGAGAPVALRFTAILLREAA
jgi:hypothetical protein